jgi:uncharacterized protein DUF4177
MADRWEYRTLTIETRGDHEGTFDTDTFDSVLNAIGKDGWELVVALDSGKTASAAREVALVFKRRR